jgi:hypothetical protein
MSESSLKAEIDFLDAQLTVAHHVLGAAKNALLDYIETLEKRGASLHYGRSVLRQIDMVLAYKYSATEAVTEGQK